MSVGTVYFIDSGDELNIRRGCKVCRVTQVSIASQQVVVSPAGIAHHGNDYGETNCGKDATGYGWWWPC